MRFRNLKTSVFDIRLPVFNFVKEECLKSTKKIVPSPSLYKIKKNLIPNVGGYKLKVKDSPSQEKKIVNLY